MTLAKMDKDVQRASPLTIVRRSTGAVIGALFIPIDENQRLREVGALYEPLVCSGHGRHRCMENIQGIDFSSDDAYAVAEGLLPDLIKQGLAATESFFESSIPRSRRERVGGQRRRPQGRPAAQHRLIEPDEVHIALRGGPMLRSGRR